MSKAIIQAPSLKSGRGNLPNVPIGARRPRSGRRTTVPAPIVFALLALFVSPVSSSAQTTASTVITEPAAPPPAIGTSPIATAPAGATPAGAALVHHAQLVIQQLERMRGELSEYADGLRGCVRLFANTTAASEFLPASLAKFLSQYPQIDIDLEEYSSRDIVRAVAGNLAEIGIVGDEVNPAKELQTFPFAEDRLVLIAPRDHAVSHQRRSRFAMPLPMTMLASLPGMPSRIRWKTMRPAPAVA